MSVTLNHIGGSDTISRGGSGLFNCCVWTIEKRNGVVTSIGDTFSRLVHL